MYAGACLLPRSPPIELIATKCPDFCFSKKLKAQSATQVKPNTFVSIVRFSISKSRFSFISPIPELIINKSSPPSSVVSSSNFCPTTFVSLMSNDFI